MLSPCPGRWWVGEAGAVRVSRPLLPRSRIRGGQHLHTFRLARCSPFRPQRFQLLIWKRKKKPAGRGRPQGGNWSRSAAPAPPVRGARCRRSPALPGPAPRPPLRPAPSRAPPFPACSSPRGDDGAGRCWTVLGGRAGGPGAPSAAPLPERRGLCRGRGQRALPGEESSRSRPPQEPLLLRGAPPGVNLLGVPK